MSLALLSGFGNRFGGEDVSVFDTETLVASSASLINIYVQSFTVGNGHLGNGPHGTARLARVDFGQGVQAADGNDFYILTAVRRGKRLSRTYMRIWSMSKGMRLSLRISIPK